MKTFVFFVVYCLLAVSTKNNSEDIQRYYERLIQENIQSAQCYQLPVDNSEFYKNLDEHDVQDYGTYDFIIVGAGSAGAVIANRLSDVKNWKILLLEAGGEEDDFSDIPSMLAYLQFGKMNWGYYSTPQKTACLGMINKQCNYPRGKVIGGCSTTNALMYVRGNPDDYNNWEKEGNTGWSFEDVLPYFKKSEKTLIDDADEGYHGTEGPWTVNYKTPAQDLYSTLAENLYLSQISKVDYNGEYQMGYSRVQYNTKEGRRQSTGRAFLDTVRYHRKNLIVTTKALVKKVLIDETNKSADAVEFIKNGKILKAYARHEIILSAGAINTPQIMMLSGIGPANELKKLGITTIQNLPVGKNMEDHATFYGLTFRTNTTVTNNDFSNHVREYLNGKGPLTDPGNNAVMGFMNTADEEADVPDMEYIFVTPNSTGDIAQRQYNLDEELNSYFKSINPTTDIRLLLILLHPKSRGSVTLQSNNIKEFPNIDINYLSDPRHRDINTIYKAIQKMMEIVETGPFKNIDAQLVPLPICKQFKPLSKKYWYCAIRHVTATLYHPTGTTRMGTNPAKSVVDNKLKVHGIKKLRVADAGVIPSTVSGHTNAPCVMIGEKISDMIKDDYRKFIGHTYSYHQHESNNIDPKIYFPDK